MKPRRNVGLRLNTTHHWFSPEEESWGGAGKSGAAHFFTDRSIAKETGMRKCTSMVAALVIGLAGCASTENKDGQTVRPQHPVPDKVTPVAAATPRPNVPAADDLAAIRDPNNPLSRRSVYFDFDNYDIKPEYAALLERHGKFLAARRAVKIMVQGHADERGSHEYNLALGQKRAEAVRRALVLNGAKDGQLEAVSLGEEKPRAPGHEEEAWTQNRRADLAYPGQH